MKEYNINDGIELSNILLVGDDQVSLTLDEALDLAYEQDLDLVQMSENNNVAICKIMDYSQFRYDRQKRDKAKRTKARETRVITKEIQIRPSTQTNDIKTKANQAKSFLRQGNKVKVNVTFKGREISHKEVGESVLSEFLCYCEPYDVDQYSTISGRNLYITIKPSIKHPSNVKGSDTNE